MDKRGLGEECLTGDNGKEKRQREREGTRKRRVDVIEALPTHLTLRPPFLLVRFSYKYGGGL